jgi:hypothetical protein
MEAVTTNYTTLKAYLGDQKTEGDLYTHVSSVMSHLVSHAPPNQALNQLEEVSYLTKKGPDHINKFMRT